MWKYINTAAIVFICIWIILWIRLVFSAVNRMHIELQTLLDTIKKINQELEKTEQVIKRD